MDDRYCKPHESDRDEYEIADAIATPVENTSDTRKFVNATSNLVRPQWAKLGRKYSDNRKIFTVQAPPGKLGLVVDTPDEGPPIIFKINDTSPLLGLVKLGDRVMAVDEVDVTAMSSVETSDVISQKSQQLVRILTLFKS